MRRNLAIDEFIVFGCPIQPETDHCAFSCETFKKIYNFYSDEDIVQQMDWVSTKQSRNERRFIDNTTDTRTKNLVQARIAMGSSPIDDDAASAKNKTVSFWQRLFSGGSKLSNDPSHKELWFFSWEDEANPYSLKPLPIMILTPLFIHAINTTNNATTSFADIDLALLIDQKKVQVTVREHDKKNIAQVCDFPSTLLALLKENSARWKPEGNHHEAEFDIISKYSSTS